MGSADPPEPVEALAAGVRAGSRAAVARALNLVEDRRAQSRPRIAELLRALGGGKPDGHRVGFTGPPGVGKSTLVSALGGELRRRGSTVGVLAVDPSSKRSGGALLGDRVRIETRPEDEGLFVRSLATAGELGGLARAAPASVLVLAAAFDRVLVETVGVGQSETDVEYVVDTVVFVVQPGSGDALQFLKAGIMEVPDVLVVTKADLGRVAQRAMADLQAAVRALGSRETPVVAVSCVAPPQGIEALVDALECHRAGLDLTARRLASRRRHALADFATEHGERGVRALGGRRAAERWLGEQAPGLDVPALVQGLQEQATEG